MKNKDKEFWRKIEERSEIFSVRVRPNVKRLLYSQMEKDGFNSMSEWFEQKLYMPVFKKAVRRNIRKFVKGGK